MKILTAVLILLMTALASLGAVEESGLSQLNAGFQAGYYPLFGSGGRDVVSYFGAGMSIKGTRGRTLQGVVDIGVFLPSVLQQKLYPAKNFTNLTGGTPVGVDLLTGVGYAFELDIVDLYLSGGIHTNVLFGGSGKYLVAFGLGVDAQFKVRFGRHFTAQLGADASTGLFGLQNFVVGINEFSGFSLSASLYNGIGITW